MVAVHSSRMNATTGGIRKIATTGALVCQVKSELSCAFRRRRWQGFPYRSRGGSPTSHAWRAGYLFSMSARIEFAEELYRTAGVSQWIRRAFRTPLLATLAAVNAFMLSAAITSALFLRWPELRTTGVAAVLVAGFLVALAVNLSIVHTSVRPLDGLVADRARTRRLAAALISASDRERAAISRELHDSTAQSLAALVMQLSVATADGGNGDAEAARQQLDGARELATTTLEEVRRLAHAVHPRVLDDLGLIAALRSLARESAIAGDGAVAVQVHVDAEAGIDAILSATAASALYRIAQEALSNARRHSGAAHIEMRVRRDVDAVVLEVSDDGVGFDPDAEAPNQKGIGLFTMRERLALIGGSVRVGRRAGGGTTLIASVTRRQSAHAGHRSSPRE